MKKIFILLLSIFCFSCDKDFLTEDAKGILSPSVVFKTEGGIVLATNALPAGLSQVYFSSDYILPFMGGDDLTADPFSCCGRFKEGDIFMRPQVEWKMGELYRKFYSTIQTSNVIIGCYDQSNDPEVVVEDCLGQAYFYRAYCYSLLTRIWGRVPLISQYNTGAYSQPVPVSEVSDIYTLIVNDLKSAEQLLPDNRNDGSYPGAKPNRGAAKTLLSQVYLTMAGWPLKQTSYYALSAAKAKEVIDNVKNENSYGYSLLSDPKDLWTWANNYTNREIVFGMYYNYQAGQVNMHSPLGSRPREYVNPDALWANGWNDYMGEISFFRRFPSGRRKDATYQTIINVPGIGNVPWDDSRTYLNHPYFKKYQEDFEGATWAGSRTEQLIRYADVLLIYAEAKAMSDGPDESAYNAVNMIRNRAGLPDLIPGLSAIAFRDSVVAERAWEFAGGEPASRWFDLVRLELVEEVTKKRDPAEMALNHFPTHEDYWVSLP